MHFHCHGNQEVGIATDRYEAAVFQLVNGAPITLHAGQCVEHSMESPAGDLLTDLKTCKLETSGNN